MSTVALGSKCVLVAATALLLSLAAPAHAQGIPSGSYAHTCTNIQSHGGQVTADCRRVDGGWDRTTLHDAYRCVGGLANTDGRLTCNGGRNVGSREHDYRDQWQGYGYRHDNDRNYGYYGGDDRWQGHGGSGYQPYGWYYNGYGR